VRTSHDRMPAILMPPSTGTRSASTGVNPATELPIAPPITRKIEVL
jgi:hypothetical protein